MRHQKFTIIILCFLLLSLNFPVAASSNEATITADNVNVRSGPGTNYTKLGQVHTDETYPILQKKDGWVEIQLENYTGWVTTAYVVTQNNTPTQPEEDVEDPTLSTLTIVHDKTQVRNGPSTENAIIYLAEEGQVFDVIGETNGWVKVKKSEIEGYIYKALIEENRDVFSNGLTGKTIVVDPGHGGDDSGAIGAKDTLEKDVTIKTANILSQELTMLGAEVIMTREKEPFVSLSSRATLANDSDADIFVSLHYNSVPDIPNATGISTYYYRDQFQPLANVIQQELIKETGDRDRGARFGDFQVIRQNMKPAVLIELGFISNPEIEELLLTNAYQKKLVSGIVSGLQQYFASH